VRVERERERESESESERERERERERGLLAEYGEGVCNVVNFVFVLVLGLGATRPERPRVARLHTSAYVSIRQHASAYEPRDPNGRV
jgi:hypothetical protein